MGGFGGLNPSLATEPPKTYEKIVYPFQLLSPNIHSHTCHKYSKIYTNVNVKNFLGHSGTFFFPDLTL